MSSRINVGKVCPIPKGNWTSTTTYEKLNMVNKSGVLYIAKQDVPANTAITNTNYWMQANGSLSIGTVETVSSSTLASATISDSTNGPVLNLSIPRGVTGNESIDDTKGFGDIDYVWSANKSYNEINNKLDANSSIKTENIVEFDAKTDHAIKDLTVSIDLVQDLHGYDSPWPAGGGKNLLWLDLATIKSINGGGTWTGNSYVHNGVTFKVNQDADGNITSFDVSGASNSNIAFLLLENRNTYNAHPITSNGAYVISGSVTPVNVTAQLFDDDTLHTITSVDGNSATYTYTNIPTITGNNNIYLYVNPNKSITGTVTVKPQLEKGSTATTYAPSSNLCPISGHSTATVTRTGKNLLQNIRDASVEINGITFTKNSDGSVTISGTASATAYYNINYLTTVATAVMDFVPLRGKQLALSVSETAVPNIQMSCEYFRADGSYEAITNATVITSGNFTVPSDAYRARTYLRVASGAVITTPVTVYPMLLVASDTDRTYEPYQGTSVTIALGNTYYGAQLDAVAGTLTVTHGIYVFTGSEEWVHQQVQGQEIDKFFTREFLVADTALLPVNNSNAVPIQTSIGIFDRPYANLENYPYEMCIAADGRFGINAMLHQDTNTLKDVQVVYELATPTVITGLTPAEVASLIGHNVLWCDTGNSTVVLRLTTGDLAYQDDIDYTSSQLKNKPSLGTMASKDDASSDTKAYGRKDGAWYDLDGRYYTEAETDSKLDNKADIIHRSTDGGDIVHITDGSPYPVDALKVGIEPVQDLHGYDNPWPAGGGKNLIEPKMATATNADVTCTNNGDGSFKLNGTASASATFRIDQSTYNGDDNLKTYKAGQYTVSGLSGGVRLIVMQNSTWIAIATFTDNGTQTVASDTENCFIYLLVPNGTQVNNVTVKPQLESGSSATTWTPYSNICPISGWSNAVVTRAGKNLLPNETYLVEKMSLPTVNEVHIFSLTDSGDGCLVAVKPNTKYTLSGDIYGSNLDHSVRIGEFTSYPKVGDIAVNYVSLQRTTTFTTGANTHWLCIWFTRYTSGYTVQLELGSSASSYEPYQGTSVTVNLNGTHYGGSLDIVNGTLTLTHGFVTFNGSEAWYNSFSNGHNRVNRTISGIKQVSTDGTIANILSNFYPTKSAVATWNGNIGISLNANSESIYILDNNFDYENSASDYQTWLSTHNLQVCYELTTPQTVTLTPAQLSTILSENYIYCDTGFIKELGYRADTETYNKQHFARKSSEIVETASGGLVHITDAAELLVEGLKVGVDPVQNLHGYDSPWPAGGGKNKLPITLAILKSNNTQGTWSDNVYTLNNVTFTVSTNVEGYVTKIVLNGTASASAPLNLMASGVHNDWIGNIVNGAPSGSSGSTSYIGGWNSTDNTGLGVYDFGSGMTLPNTLQDKSFRIYIAVPNGSANSNREFYPMIRDSAQSATFAPYSNICPISGHTSAVVTRTGINIWDEEWEAGGINTATGIKSNSTTSIISKNLIPIVPTASYYAVRSYPMYPFFYDKDGNYIGYVGAGINGEFTPINKTNSLNNGKTFATARYMKFRCDEGSTYLNDISINYPSTDTAYHAGSVKTVTIALGSTVYGAQLDAVAGTLTVTHGIINLGTIGTWINNSGIQTGRFDGGPITDKKVGETNIICSQYKVVTSAEMSTSDFCIRGGSANQNIVIVDSSKSTLTAEQFKTAMDGVQVVYELATPTVITGLTPAQIQALQGLNNVWADTGDTSIGYLADTKLYIDKKFAELQALILEN